MISKEYINSLNEPELLKKNRLDNFEVFSSLDTPKFFRYGISLVFRMDNFNFDFKKIKSSIGIDKKEFIADQDEILNHLALGDNKFDSFFNAFLNRFLVLKIPKDAETTLNIDISLEEVGCDCIILIAEENARINVLQREAGKGIARFGKVKIIAKENAEVNYVIHQNFDNLKNFFWMEGQAENNSKINLFIASLGSEYSKIESRINLNGEGSESKTYGLFFGINNQQFDIYNETKHIGKNTSSNMLTKGVVKDKSKALYRGLIDVSKNAFGTNGYQKEDVLILNDGAEADAVPNLEINNNDVKCSHGVSIGRIDEEHLFYLESRGLNEKEAKREIIEGFFHQVLKDFSLKTPQEIKERV